LSAKEIAEKVLTLAGDICVFKTTIIIQLIYSNTLISALMFANPIVQIANHLIMLTEIGRGGLKLCFENDPKRKISSNEKLDCPIKFNWQKTCQARQFPIGPNVKNIAGAEMQLPLELPSKKK